MLLYKVNNAKLNSVKRRDMKFQGKKLNLLNLSIIKTLKLNFYQFEFEEITLEYNPDKLTHVNSKRSQLKKSLVLKKKKFGQSIISLEKQPKIKSKSIKRSCSL